MRSWKILSLILIASVVPTPLFAADHAAASGIYAKDATQDIGRAANQEIDKAQRATDNFVRSVTRKIEIFFERVWEAIVDIAHQITLFFEHLWKKITDLFR